MEATAMKDGQLKAVITDYDYPDLAIETEILAKNGIQVLGAQCKSEDELIAIAQDADALLVQYARVGERTIKNMPDCKVIARYGIGVDIVDVKAATDAGIIVTNVAHYCIDEVADHAVSMFLCLARRLREYDTAVREGRWHWSACGAPISRLKGQVAGVVGFGQIGSRIAARLKPFGMEVVVYDPYIADAKLAEFGARKVNMAELLSESDAIFVQAPLTDATRHMFDAKAFAAMKTSAILVNTSRGPMVDNQALYEALVSGQIRGAALDDLEDEPAKKRNWQPTNALLKLGNILVSPHAAYYSEEAIIEARSTAASEASRVLIGQMPLNVVNREVLVSRKLRAVNLRERCGA
ncbi:MAG TPA: C-terminal binding protein [Firmicutes bacterium]|jgi:D-3-phosphoglycerate dehydrogenase|nr:C-terminal binding protein [Bacillota bacterium]